MTEQDLYYMKEALLEGEKALAEGEVPIGAVMVRDGEIIARGHNMRNTAKNPLRHAEIDVINEAAGVGGLHIVCDRRALSHVCRRHRPGKDSQSGVWHQKQQGRLRRIYFGSAQ